MQASDPFVYQPEGGQPIAKLQELHLNQGPGNRWITLLICLENRRNFIEWQKNYKNAADERRIF